MRTTINIGILGAARIGNWGIVQPCRQVAAANLYAVAARDPAKAKKYARKYKIPQVFPSYEAMLADKNIQAIYNPLPNGLHCEWTIKALDAGKHVLCEKPFSNNADEVLQVEAAAKRNNKVVMEAVHYKYHPLAAEMQRDVARLGAILSIHTTICAPITNKKDIRYDFRLGGGATMDMGAYSVSLLQLLAKASADPALHKEPVIMSATALLEKENVDRDMRVKVEWANGTSSPAKGFMHHALWSSTILDLSAKVIGENGELHVINPFVPQLFHRYKLILNGTTIIKKFKSNPSYTHQLEEFLRRVNTNTTDLSETFKTMQMIDAIYEKAGLSKRGV